MRTLGKAASSMKKNRKFRVMITIVPTLFDYILSDKDTTHKTISKEQADELFVFFEKSPLFNWKNSHNGCEGRADAVCVLLDEWDIPNFKGWVFGGTYLKKGHIGQLKNNWNYHVAPILPVDDNGKVVYFILDPATGDGLQTVEDWASSITLIPHSYYCIRKSCWYIFPEKNISKKKWHHRNKQNRKWMIQCLQGINSLTKTGRAHLIFNKFRLQKTKESFQKLKNYHPF
ncbi:MAG: hypothetical protein DI598_19155 [Pseudopedobacter saltans]|uniref:Protein glutaminase domain-containing protein n=1 Tax=Pseudopedobacter saltans TaxID=151895 RepID=A0A2W5EF95_9SPHI|nr:MAG: hypothetical protein DI598_19155 [Pseudopedobacter saltans]